MSGELYAYAAPGATGTTDSLQQAKTWQQHSGGNIYIRLDVLRGVEEQVAVLRAALDISPDDMGRIMHESWSRTKRAQGFHGRWDGCIVCGSNVKWGDKRLQEYPFGAQQGLGLCSMFHPDLIPWEELPQGQQDLNLHAFDDVLAEIRRRAAP